MDMQHQCACIVLNKTWSSWQRWGPKCVTNLCLCSRRRPSPWTQSVPFELLPLPMFLTIVLFSCCNYRTAESAHLSYLFSTSSYFLSSLTLSLIFNIISSNFIFHCSPLSVPPSISPALHLWYPSVSTIILDTPSGLKSTPSYFCPPPTIATIA